MALYIPENTENRCLWCGEFLAKPKIDHDECKVMAETLQNIFGDFTYEKYTNPRGSINNSLFEKLETAQGRNLKCM